MVKQLYYSEIHSKNIGIYLSKLYTGKYSEVNDVIKYMPKTRRLLTAARYKLYHVVQVAVL